jgi:PAS domain S-box-containing protein
LITGSHDNALVALSVILAVVASFTALDLAGRTNAASDKAWSRIWLAAAAFAMGGGIWSMHFVAMLAYSMPGMEAYYDPGLTLLSFVLAVFVTGAGFATVSRSQSLLALLASGLLMGLGIVAMHFTGMAAMRMPVQLRYDLVWVAVSIFIAIGASIAALWLAFRRASPSLKFLAAIAMGLAVAGMHYAGMRAASFTSSAVIDHAQHGTSIGQTNLALVVATLTLLILFLAMLAALFDRRFASMAEREAAALRKSEDLFRALYRRTPLPLHALDLQGRIEDVSDAWLDLLGYGREEVVGRHLTDFMTEESADRRKTIDWPTLLATGGTLAREYELRTKTGQLLSVVSTSRVERDLRTGDDRVVGGLVDLTARKQAERALVQSQKMEAIGQLTGGVAHDFNNLLAVVLGNLELLQKRLPPEPRTQRMISNALEGARRGASLTQRMLSFARKQDMRVEPVAVSSLISSMTDLLQGSIGQHIPIETRIRDDLPPALVDPNQLELALINLAVNARDAMPSGGSITIAVSQRSIMEETAEVGRGDYISISLTDTGTGMSAETLSRAREPFFTTKGVGKGTGLGLSMVHGFAAQSGGAFLLTSQLGQGTTAEILLPVAREAFVDKPTDRPAPSEPKRTLSILAVDDDALVLMNTVEMLMDYGHQVSSAMSGHEAIGMITTLGPFDLLVTDQAMPGMLGIELCRRVRELQPAMPIVIATGYGELSDVPDGINVLAKPFTDSKLLEAIACALARTKTEATAPSLSASTIIAPVS